MTGEGHDPGSGRRTLADDRLDALDARLDGVDAEWCDADRRRLSLLCAGCAAFALAVLALPWGRNATELLVGTLSAYAAVPAAPVIAASALAASGLSWRRPRLWPATLWVVLAGVAGFAVCVPPWVDDTIDYAPAAAAWLAPPAFVATAGAGVVTLLAHRGLARSGGNERSAKVRPVASERDAAHRLRGEWQSRKSD